VSGAPTARSRMHCGSVGPVAGLAQVKNPDSPAMIRAREGEWWTRRPADHLVEGRTLATGEGRLGAA
jgi:hypothetical protein